MSNVVIHWFRQDLRLSDNPALLKAASQGKVLAVYILDDKNAGKDAMGAASRLWLHHSLSELNASLGGKLNFYSGDAVKIIDMLVKHHQAKAVYWNRCYENWRIKRDGLIKENLKKDEITSESFNASLLFEPWETLKSDGSQYKIFTPFFKNSYMGSKQPRLPLAQPEEIELVRDLNSDSLEQLELLPKTNWGSKISSHLQSGEKAGQLRLNQFLDSGIGSYKVGRDFPSKSSVSGLSPYLHFGEISPNQAWYAAKMKNEDENSERFCSELGWREFSYSLLYHFPELPDKNWQAKFDNFPWRYDKELLEKWQKGQTGFPIIDAGMRELWQTGYMHNRVRMIVASFLVKNLLIDWRCGAKWFWDCLFDADLAANSASWQWVAGCGADAAPYFRIFNPITQGEKFDPQGQYTRRFVPELAKLPDKYLFAPWQASDEILSKAGVILGKNYPKPIVDLKESRKRALSALALMSNPTS